MIINPDKCSYMCLGKNNNIDDNSSVIRQKSNLKTEVSRKQNTPNFPKNKHFLPPDTHTPKACNFIKKETLAHVFSCEFCEISKNPFFTEHLWTAASQDYKSQTPLHAFKAKVRKWNAKFVNVG